MRKHKKIEKKVSSTDYRDWLYTALLNKKSICDEADYDNTIDVENAELLGYFHYYLESLAEKYDAVHHWVDNDSYLFFRIRDRYFRICIIYGQGSMTWVEALSDKPPYKFVALSDFDNKTYVLVEYNPIAAILYKYKVFYRMPFKEEILEFNELVYIENQNNQRITMTIEFNNIPGIGEIENGCKEAFKDIYREAYIDKTNVSLGGSKNGKL